MASGEEKNNADGPGADAFENSKHYKRFYHIQQKFGDMYVNVWPQFYDPIKMDKLEALEAFRSHKKEDPSGVYRVVSYGCLPSGYCNPEDEEIVQ